MKRIACLGLIAVLPYALLVGAQVPLHSIDADDVLTVTIPGNIEMKFCKIPAGEFTMGSPVDEKDRDGDEGPLRKITISNSFYLGMYEVTQEQWQALMGRNPSHFKTTPKHPVEQVSWHDCQEFIVKLNDLGLGEFRLPTEAEWEYACRAGTTTRFYWGDDMTESEIADHAWFADNSDGQTYPVGQKTPNAWGLYDMSGNVWEWCSDWYGMYAPETAIDPIGPEHGSGRVSRGGGWDSRAWVVRSASRCGDKPTDRDNYLGFRLVRIP